MKVCVIGTGHVGLVTCVTLAKLGHEVVGVDTDPEKVEKLKRGISPFYEPGVEELLAEGTAAGRLRFESAGELGVAEADVVFVCVGTPARLTGEANLLAVERAARDVARFATGRTVVVEKSTVPAGTAERVRRTLLREKPQLHGDIEVASNPEFLREGQAVRDSLEPDRILVGAEAPWAFERLRELYAPLIEAGVPLIETDIVTAELSKHACNGFLSLKISYANALARICERAGADVQAVTAVMGADERIGSSFLRAGIGYGGYCFPKDLVAFERLADQLGYDFGLLREVAHINDQAVRTMAARIKEVLWNLEDKRIGLVGLAFKAGTDDIRFSPAIALARLLIDEGATVVAFDPQAGTNAKAEEPRIEIVTDPYDVVEDAHCLVIGTDWPEFAELDFDRIHKGLIYPVIFDGRNLLDRSEMAEKGFSYYPTGRPAVI